MSFWSSIGDAFSTVGHFAADHWKEIAVVAASTVVFAGVLVLTGGTAALLAPTLAQLAIAGVASGATGAIVVDLLDGKTPTVGDVVKGAVIGGVVTVATAGLGRFVPGLARPLENQIAQRAVITAAGSAGGAGAQILSNAVDGEPIFANVPEAAVRGGATTLLASEGLRLVAPRIANAAGRDETVPRGREIVPEPEPVLSQEQAAQKALDTSSALARDLRMPEGTPVTGKALDGVPRSATAVVDRSTGQTYTGVTGGPLNEAMARVLAERGYDVPAMQRNLDVESLRSALRDPEVRSVLQPEIADRILAMPDSELTAVDPSSSKPFLALPWHCSEVQALNAALQAGANPANVSVATTLARTNPGRIGQTGTPFKSCPRCTSIVGDFHAENVTDQALAQHSHTVTSDTTAATDGATTTTTHSEAASSPSSAASTPHAPSATEGINKALGGVSE